MLISMTIIPCQKIMNMLYMIKKGGRRQNGKAVKVLSADYLQYLQTLPKEQLFSNDILEFIASETNSSNDKFFKMFVA